MWPSLDFRPEAHSTHGSWLGMYGNMHVIGLYFRQKPGCSCRCFLMSPVQHIETLLLYAKKNNDSSRYFTELCLFCPLDASPFDLSRQAFSVCDPKSGQKLPRQHRWRWHWPNHAMPGIFILLLYLLSGQKHSWFTWNWDIPAVVVQRCVFNVCNKSIYIYIDTDRHWPALICRVSKSSSLAMFKQV